MYAADRATQNTKFESNYLPHFPPCTDLLFSMKKKTHNMWHRYVLVIGKHFHLIDISRKAITT